MTSSEVIEHSGPRCSEHAPSGAGGRGPGRRVGTEPRGTLVVHVPGADCFAPPARLLACAHTAGRRAQTVPSSWRRAVF